MIEALSRAFVPRHLLAEMTSRCNLRCLYCQKSLPAWNAIPGRDEDMPVDMEERVFDALQRLPFKTVQLSGIGEFTFRKDWTSTLSKFIERGISVTLISNFAKPFEDEELATLLRLSHLMVSVDTTDAAMLRSVRKSVSLATIATNLLRLRMTARRRGVPMPHLRINAVLYAENLTGIEDLAYFAIENRVAEMQYERMYDLSHLSPPTDIAKASPDAAREALRQCEVARRVLAEQNIHASFHGDLLQLLTERAHALPE